MKASGRWSRLWAALGRGGSSKPYPAAESGAAPKAALEADPATPAPGASARAAPLAGDDLAGGDELEAIRQVERDSPESRARALDVLRRAAGTSLEHQALAACLTAHGRRRAPAELLCLAAELFTRRGDPDAALHLLEGLDEPQGWLLEADLRAERGQHAAALALVERALAYSIDAPGALERVRSWRPQKIATPGANQPTLLAAEAPHPSFAIVREAGRGGAATVYQAEDAALGRSVALKVYHRPERSREHVLREARTAVKFSGSGVVRVFDAAPDAGWLAMEWAARGSLRQCLERDPQEIPELEATFFGLVATLARIHGAGYVHADVKPGNILFRADHGVLLSDFGLAVPVGESHRGQSPGYAPPERMHGGAASAADDVYALGRVLDDMLAAGANSQNLFSWRGLAALLTSDERPRDAAAVRELLPLRASNH